MAAEDVKDDVGILILDDDEESQLALRHILDTEGWRVKVVPLASQGMAELSSGEWVLVIANVALTDLNGTTFETLRELAHADVVGPGRRRVRVLFLVPRLVALQAQPVLDRERLPYALKPFHLHDLLQKVSDLLLEAQAIRRPIRQMRDDLLAKERDKKSRRSGKDRRQAVMFAERKDYQMTEEELAEYERQEVEERAKRLTEDKDKKDLGRP